MLRGCNLLYVLLQATDCLVHLSPSVQIFLDNEMTPHVSQETDCLVHWTPPDKFSWCYFLFLVSPQESSGSDSGECDVGKGKGLFPDNPFICRTPSPRPSTHLDIKGSCQQLECGGWECVCGCGGGWVGGMICKIQVHRWLVNVLPLTPIGRI